MAHGDDQRIGGELGYTSSDLPVASQDDVDAAVEAAEVDAANVVVDTAEFVTPLDPEVSDLATVIASFDARIDALENP